MKRLFAIAAPTAALVLAGCGGSSYPSVDEVEGGVRRAANANLVCVSKGAGEYECSREGEALGVLTVICDERTCVGKTDDASVAFRL